MPPLPWPLPSLIRVRAQLLIALLLGSRAREASCGGGWRDNARARAAHAYAPPTMLHIDWRRGPDRPVGTQDSVAGVLGDDFVVALGNRGVVGGPAHVTQGGMWAPGLQTERLNRCLRILGGPRSG